MWLKRFSKFDKGCVMSAQGAELLMEGIARDRYKAVSFFSGCGGLDLGFIGGFEYRGEFIPRSFVDVVKAYDFNGRAVHTYKENIGGEVEVLDLGMADVKSLPLADILLGGFPCQEFSLCGPRKGLDSERGRLYKAMVRYAKVHKPKIIVAENVANILYINNGWDFSVIKREFSRAGYRCVEWAVNAADFGVPQVRQRVFIVFVRKDLPGAPERPVPSHDKAWRSTEWAIGDLVDVTDDSVANQSQYFKAAVASGGHGQGDEICKRNYPSYTIRANAKSRIQFHYELPRRLTVRECARIQTFPDTFYFPFAATESIMQIGNAVPPLLANRVMNAVVAYLDSISATARSSHG